MQAGQEESTRGCLFANHALLQAAARPHCALAQPMPLLILYSRNPHCGLQETLQPTSLEIRNDSSKHAGHSGNPTGAPDAETHFQCVGQAGVCAPVVANIRTASTVAKLVLCGLRLA